MLLKNADIFVGEEFVWEINFRSLSKAKHFHFFPQSVYYLAFIIVFGVILYCDIVSFEYVGLTIRQVGGLFLDLGGSQDLLQGTSRHKKHGCYKEYKSKHGFMVWRRIKRSFWLLKTCIPKTMPTSWFSERAIWDRFWRISQLIQNIFHPRLCLQSLAMGLISETRPDLANARNIPSDHCLTAENIICAQM